jgi:hypothetical protein
VARPVRERRDRGRRPLLGARAPRVPEGDYRGRRRGRSSVGAFAPRTFRRGGTLTWGGRAYGLRPASAWKERYALTAPEAEGGGELATIEGRGWGKRPVRVDALDPTALPPGLLLFAVYVVRTLAEDSQAAAGGAAVAAGGAAASG